MFSNWPESPETQAREPQNRAICYCTFGLGSLLLGIVLLNNPFHNLTWLVGLPSRVFTCIDSIAFGTGTTTLLTAPLILLLAISRYSDPEWTPESNTTTGSMVGVYLLGIALSVVASVVHWQVCTRVCSFSVPAQACCAVMRHLTRLGLRMPVEITATLDVVLPNP